MNKFNFIIKKHPKEIKIIKGIVVAIFSLLVISDIVLVALQDKCFPTYSWLVRDNRSYLIWLPFLFGGLVSKIYFCRIVYKPESEIKGFFLFCSILLLLIVLGRQCLIKVDAFIGLLLLVSGGFCSFSVWPQFVEDLNSLNNKNYDDKEKFLL
jgi:hypothetical protein